MFKFHWKKILFIILIRKYLSILIIPGHLKSESIGETLGKYKNKSQAADNFLEHLFSLQFSQGLTAQPTLYIAFPLQH